MRRFWIGVLRSLIPKMLVPGAPPLNFAGATR
jgi:hypothetical protein